MPKEKKLKAFLVTYKIVDYDYDGPITTVHICAYDAEEAKLIFNQHLSNKHYVALLISVQSTRKNKKNARFFTKEYYDKQRFLVFECNSNTQLFKERWQNE